MGGARLLEYGQVADHFQLPGALGPGQLCLGSVQMAEGLGHAAAVQGVGPFCDATGGHLARVLCLRHVLGHVVGGFGGP